MSQLSDDVSGWCIHEILVSKGLNELKKISLINFTKNMYFNFKKEIETEGFIVDRAAYIIKLSQLCIFLNFLYYRYEYCNRIPFFN